MKYKYNLGDILESYSNDIDIKDHIFGRVVGINLKLDNPTSQLSISHYIEYEILIYPNKIEYVREGQIIKKLGSVYSTDELNNI